MARERRTTEIGEEIQCNKCKDFWPIDKEFYYFNGATPYSWCKDCYTNDDKVKAKYQRSVEKMRSAAAAAA